MSELTEGQRETLLAPCVCGHTINDHGSLVACWLCEDEGSECSVTFEALLAERIAAMLAEARAEVWDGGFNAGEQDVHEHERLGDWESPCIPNPYLREEGDR